MNRYILSLLLVAALAPLTIAQGAGSESGKTFFYIRVWPDFVIKFDPETDKEVARCKLRHGVNHGFDVSHDESQFFVTTGKRAYVEVIDRKQMKVVDEHMFAEAGYLNRVSDVKEIPGGKKWYVKLDRVKKELDHFVIEEDQWLLYNVAEKKIEKRMKKLPEAIRRGARISPDGKSWHVFSSDIIVIDPTTLKETGRVKLSQPLYHGLGPISPTGDDYYRGRNAEAYRMFYTMRDPVKTSRRLFGIVDIDMKNLKVASINEWGARPGMWRMRLTDDWKFMIGQGSGRSTNADGDRESVFLTYDVEKRALVRESRLVLRNGLSIVAISPDGGKIYLGGRGHEIVIHGRDHEYLKTVELSGEFETRFTAIRER